MTNTPKPLPVSDIPAELWIKVLSGLAAVTLLLISFIGVRTIDKLDQIGATLSGVVGLVQVHGSEISALRSKDEEILIKVDGNTRQINILRGLK